MANQMVFKRYEFKYMMTEDQQHELLERMSEHMRADEHGKSTILSLYFDTPDWRLIRRSLEHPMYKEKLRLRSYGKAGDDTKVFVELKKKYDSVVYKRRISMKAKDAYGYLLDGKETPDSQIKREIDYALDFYDDLKPRMLLTYDREAYYDKQDHEFRITFDRNILWRTEKVTLYDEIGGNPLLKEDQVLMEVKVGGAMPLWFSHILADMKLYKTKFTKYGTAYETMLKMNKMTEKNLEEKTDDFKHIISGNIRHRSVGTGNFRISGMYRRRSGDRRISGGSVRVSK